MPLQIQAVDSISGQSLKYSATGLPIGLSLNTNTGVISGTPSTTGTFTPVVTVKDSLGVSGSVSFTWFITSGGGNVITVTSPGNQTATLGLAVSLTVTATDSATGQTLTFSATGLPPGLAISSAGVITGTPTAKGNFTSTVTATDTTSASGAVVFSWTVTGGTGNVITVTNPGNQANNTGSSVSLQITATDSAASQTLTYSATGLPSGLAISSNTGLISGTVSGAPNNYSTVITATDTTGANGAASFTWQVPPANVVTVTNPGSQSNTVGNNVNLQISALDSASGQVLSYSASGLPAGLSINQSSGLISGSPVTVQVTNATVNAIDTTGALGSASFSWTINAAPGYVPFVGGTTPMSATRTGCYDFGQSQVQEDKNFMNAVGRPGGSSPKLLACKKFWENGNVNNWKPTYNDMANYHKNGTRIIMCLQPAFAGGYTDDSNLTIFLRAIASLGFTSSTANVVLWQEPEVASHKMSASQYQGMLKHYGPIVNSINGADGEPFGIVCDIGSGAGTSTAQSYANAAINAMNAGVTLLGLAQDFYLPAWARPGANQVTLDAVASVADANGLPFGVYEFGCAPNNFPSGATAGGVTYSTGKTLSTAFLNYIHNYMLNRKNSGKKNLDVMYYSGICQANGQGDLTSPIGQDPTVTATYGSPDFRISLYQRIFDDLNGG